MTEELCAVKLNREYWLEEYMKANDIIEVRIDGDKVEKSLWKEVDEKCKVVYEENHDFQERHIEVLNILHDVLQEWSQYVDILLDVPDSGSESGYSNGDEDSSDDCNLEELVLK